MSALATLMSGAPARLIMAAPPCAEQREDSAGAWCRPCPRVCRIRGRRHDCGAARAPAVRNRDRPHWGGDSFPISRRGAATRGPPDARPRHPRGTADFKFALRRRGRRRPARAPRAIMMMPRAGSVGPDLSGPSAARRLGLSHGPGQRGRPRFSAGPGPGDYYHDRKPTADGTST